MRLALVVALTALAVATPVFAETPEEIAAAKAVIADAGLSVETDMNMWCGAAFTAVSVMYTSQGDAETAKLASDAAGILFGKAAPLLTADGVADEDMADISTQYMIVAYSQAIDKTEEASYTQEDCQAAAEAP